MEQDARQIEMAAGRLGFAVLRLCLGMNITMLGLSRLISGEDASADTLMSRQISDIGIQRGLAGHRLDWGW